MVRKLIDISVRITASLIFTGVALSANAATNVATDPGGGITKLGSSNVVTINSLELNFVKNARRLDGTIIPDSSNLAGGTKFYFVIYLDNPTDTPVVDVSIFDTVAAGPGNFTVDMATFEILNEAGPGIDMNAANDAAWNGTASWLGLNWEPQNIDTDGDYLDWNVTTPGTLTVGSAPGNRQLDVPASLEVDPVADPRRIAVRFQVLINP